MENPQMGMQQGMGYPPQYGQYPPMGMQQQQSPFAANAQAPALYTPTPMPVNASSGMPNMTIEGGLDDLKGNTPFWWGYAASGVLNPAVNLTSVLTNLSLGNNAINKSAKALGQYYLTERRKYSTIQKLGEDEVAFKDRQGERVKDMQGKELEFKLAVAEVNANKEKTKAYIQQAGMSDRAQILANQRDFSNYFNGAPFMDC